MNTNWQTIIAIAIAVLSAAWAAYMLLVPFIASLRPANPNRCPGGCGCGHEEKKAEGSQQ